PSVPDTIDALNDAGISVHAINTGTAASGMNATQDGVAAGATQVATGTGGTITNGVPATGSAIVDAIEAALLTALTTYTTVGLDLSEVPAGVLVSSTPGSYVGDFDRSIERTFDFEVTFTGVSPGTHN